MVVAKTSDPYYEFALRDHWEGANKYRQIRATADDRQVVEQLWLAFPGLPEAIMPLDPAVTWTTTGPDRPLDEAVDGFSGH